MGAVVDVGYWRGMGGLDKAEGLHELPLISSYCDGGKKTKEQTLQVLSEHPPPASASQKSNGAFERASGLPWLPRGGAD